VKYEPPKLDLPLLGTFGSIFLLEPKEKRS